MKDYNLRNHIVAAYVRRRFEKSAGGEV